MKDYNYSNAAVFATESLRPTDAPLSTYVSTLSWCVTNAETGQVVAERAAYLAPTDRQRDDISLPDTLPFGRYVVSVWGGMPEGLEFPELINLDDPAEDPYLVHDTLTYDARHADHTLLLRRIKSKLDISIEGLPEAWEATSSQKKETGLYEECDKSLHTTARCKQATVAILVTHGCNHLYRIASQCGEGQDNGYYTHL